LGDLQQTISTPTETIIKRYQQIRERSIQICKPLRKEDYVVQPVVDVSPPKWHLGHTTWFFETFVLKEFQPGYKLFDPDYNFMFNSYYETVGARVIRTDRGNMSRPSIDDVYAYREYVDQHVLKFLKQEERTPGIEYIIEIGLQHEQQHQELLITDIKYILGNNPLFPAYFSQKQESTSFDLPQSLEENYREVPEGIYEIGHGEKGFCFDNEKGRHKVYLHDFKFLDRLVTVGEYLEFMREGGYQDFRFWLSDGWTWVNENDIKAPFYWYKMEDGWHSYTLYGLQKINLSEPITHISYYEADAYAQWKGKRLLTEFEWEVACCENCPKVSPNHNFMDTSLYHPQTMQDENMQFLGDVWEWTGSAYLPYPNFKKEKGALGEYNGKFMINQMVLRGGSCATPRDHIRSTYRNFFQPYLRWQFTGIRLGQSL